MRTQNSRFDSVYIKSTGSYVPARVLRNEDLVGNLPTSPDWIFQTLGIRERAIAEPDEYTSDLAARAGLNAIASAGLEPNEIDLIIVATSTPDRKCPSAACMAQAKMGIRNGCAAFDVAAVCSGFLYGITIAGQFIQNGTYGHVLVIGADTFSKSRTGTTATASFLETAPAPWCWPGTIGRTAYSRASSWLMAGA